MTNDPAEMLESVENIARDAGEILMDYFGRISKVEYKGIGDIVTEADKASEQFIKASLESLFPNDSTLGEEFGLSDVESENCWVTDPLDGTANYAAGLPIFSVAIGLLANGSPILGVVFDPNTDRMFSATKDRAATLNGKAIQANRRAELDPIGLFGFSSEVMKALNPFMQNLAKGRSLGSAALHICGVAAGHFDGSLDYTTKLWDVTAATAILEAAGGRVSLPSGEPIFPLSTDSSAYRGASVPFLATNGKLHEECVDKLDQIQP
ncbi:MAG: inositol monophosphatase family protein [Candidatus Poribacteria bacterium]|nr:inositol monophosphatase family protein [Candidatus Poribacteria bacterium]MDE0505510.1 inositol monophosphatase family protein [Candidatus Poribacteria bacterium]